MNIKLPKIRQLKSISRDDPFVQYVSNINSGKNGSSGGLVEDSFDSDSGQEDNEILKGINLQLLKYVSDYKFKQKTVINSDDIIDRHDRNIEELAKKGKWRNQDYWRLPENVRKAVDNAKSRSNESDFEQRLQLLNDKITIYRSAFYSREPQYEKKFSDQEKNKLLMEKHKITKEFNKKLRKKLLNQMRVDLTSLASISGEVTPASKSRSRPGSIQQQSALKVVFNQNSLVSPKSNKKVKFAKMRYPSKVKTRPISKYRLDQLHSGSPRNPTYHDTFDQEKFKTTDLMNNDMQEHLKKYLEKTNDVNPKLNRDHSIRSISLPKLNQQETVSSFNYSTIKTSRRSVKPAQQHHRFSRQFQDDVLNPTPNTFE